MNTSLDLSPALAALCELHELEHVTDGCFGSDTSASARQALIQGNRLLDEQCIMAASAFHDAVFDLCFFLEDSADPPTGDQIRKQVYSLLSAQAASLDIPNDYALDKIEEAIGEAPVR